VAEGTEPDYAYELVGLTPGRRNHNRLLRNPDLRWRIEELKREREALARAAAVPIDRVLAALAAKGVDRLEDLFDRNAAGIPSVRPDLRSLPVEVSIALLRCLREGLGIKNGSP
jgi:hypothetical protein